MNKRWIWILIATMLLIIGFIVFMIVRQKMLETKPFNVYDYPIALSLAHHVFGYDSLEILIYYVPEHVNRGDMFYYGIVEKNPFRENSFLILLDRNIKINNLFVVMSHEFIHIDQYLRGDLEVIYPYVIWKGDTLNLNDIEYRDRPFEKEAYNNQNKIAREVRNIIF